LNLTFKSKLETEEMKPKTWLEMFQEEIGFVDLSKPCIFPRKKDAEDVHIGILDEYLQKLYRILEEHREAVESIQSKMEDVVNVRDTEDNLGQLTNERSKSHLIAMGDLLDQFQAKLMPYIMVKQMFASEIENEYSIAFNQFTFVGVRDGKVLVGRHDNSRGDENYLSDFFHDMQTIFEIIKLLKLTH